MPESATEKTAEELAANTPETVVVKDEALENFSWDDGTDNFFGVENSAIEKTEVETVIAEVKKEDETTTPTATETTEEETEDESFFGVKENEKTGVVEEVTETEEVVEDHYKSIATKMKEKGIFQNIDLPEEEELTEDKFIELQDLEVETRVDEAFEGFFSELDSDAAAFLKFKKEGGQTAEFFKVYGQNTDAPTGDLDDEHYQEKVSRYYYANVDKDSTEDIDDKIEWLKSSGKLEKYAEKFDTKLKANDKIAKKELAEAVVEQGKTADANKKAFNNSVQEALDTIDKVDNFIFTAKSKKSLFPFITKQTVKVGKNRYITPMQSKLGTALKDPAKMLVLAQLLENDFDVSSIVANGTTVKTKELKKDIQRQKSVNPTSSGRVNKKRSLSDVDF